MPQNAYFQLNNREDGLFIVLYPPRDGGQALTFLEINLYLTKVKANKIEKEVLKLALTRQIQTQEIKLSDATIPSVDETISAKISDDKLSATVRVYMESNDGKKLDRDEFLRRLADAGVKYGLLEESIDKWLEKRAYCTDFPVAEGFGAEESTDASIEYSFNTDKGFKPATNEKGNIDFHQLNLLNNVSAGDVLAVLTPAYEGKHGMTVMGITIPSKKPVRMKLKFGTNTVLSEDECTLTAAVSGHVEKQMDKIVVHNIYNIRGDVGTATGDINYEGSVKITGDVLAGYSVKATGDITVDGVVEAAYLEAGGNIYLAKGMHGDAKGTINAGGSVVAKYIQMCTVVSGGNVTSNSILHSRVSARDCINADIKPGLVSGGELRAKTLISARVVGSSAANASTLLEVGPDPTDTEEFRNLEKLLVDKRGEQRRMRQVVGTAAREAPNSPKLAEIKGRLVMIDTEIEELLKRYNSLKLDIESASTGKVTVQEIVHDGTKIVISNVSYYVRDDIAACQFVNVDSEVKFYSL